MQMFIGGKKTDSRDGKVINIINPATSEVVDTVPSATVEDIAKAIEIAQEGKRIWAGTPMNVRTEILLKCADAIERNKKGLSTLLTMEMGKVIKESEGEIGVVIKLFRGFAEVANHMYGVTMPESPDLIFERREPLGVVVCIVPFNFPAELWAHKVAPALAMGNAVIAKPPSDNPLTVMRLTEILLECGIPGSVLQILTGKGSIVGKYLSSSADVNAISFTGSTEVGLDLLKEGTNNLKKVFLELGGNDPMIIFDDADLDLAVDEAFFGRMLNNGQTCCATKRFIVQNTIKEQFINKIINKIKKMSIGDPLDYNTDACPLINESAAVEIEKQVELTLTQGAKCVLGGHRYNKTYFQPTLLDEVKPDMDIAKDMEVFGPIFPVIGFDTMEEAVKIANNTKYGLNGAVSTKDINKAIQVAKQMECGTVVINGCSCYRVCDMAFGGYKMSGTGREGFICTLEEMSQIKNIVIRGINKMF